MHLQFFLFKPPPLSVAFLSHKQSKNFEGLWHVVAFNFTCLTKFGFGSIF